MTIFLIKNGKIKISFILVFLNLSALFTYLFKLSWNHQLKYCTRLCKIHFMFHLCCWFSSAVTDKPMKYVRQKSHQISQDYTKVSLNARLDCFVFFLICFDKECYIVYPEKPFLYRRRKLSKNHIYLRTLCWKN